MKVLFLSSRVPYPPDRGDRLRAYNSLRILARNHDVDLATLSEKNMNPDSRKVLMGLCNRVEECVLRRSRSLALAARGLLSPEPLQVWYYRDARMASLVRRMAAESDYDMVYSHLFRVFPFALLVPDAYQLLDLTDVVSQEVLSASSHRHPPMNWVYRMEGNRIQRFELCNASMADECWVISETERSSLASIGVNDNVTVIPNGIDGNLISADTIDREIGRIVFLGHLEVFHNVDGIRFFCENVFPAIREEMSGQARLSIAGQGDSGGVNRFAEMDGVSLLGYVPDLRPYLAGAQVFVAPLRVAAGVQNKVIQAMAVGTPVVASSCVVRGLGAEPDRHILVADSTEEWIRQVTSLLKDPERCRKVGESGREFALQRFSWEKMSGRIEAIQALISESI